MKLVPLTQGKFAKVSDRDYPRVRKYKWCLCQKKYAVSWVDGRIVYLHRLIMGFPKAEIDHKDGDGLNNQRRNLRCATNNQNAQNCGIRHDNTSGFKGAYCRGKRWAAQIRVSGRVCGLGSHDTLEEAARAYDKAARKHFGRFAHTNFTGRTSNAETERQVKL